jgi:O-antigen/teichoic acid export membrane protein
LERGDAVTLQNIIWSSIFTHIFLGICGGLILFAIADILAVQVLKTPMALRNEIRGALYLLAFSVPLVVIAAVFRGLLEALNRFDLVNIVKIPSSVINYIGPLLIVWMLTNHLVPVVGIIAVGRAAVLVLYIYFCFRLLPLIKYRTMFDWATVKNMLGYGGWLTVSNMTNSVLPSLDRFMIGAFISVAAVAYYATPYEIITKLWLFSASLLAVLFPKFSAMGVNQMEKIPGLYSRAVSILLSLTTPCVALFLAFGYELMSVWIGTDFALESTPVLTWLSIGVLVNVLAQVPSTFMQSMGRADIPAKLHLCELPLYAVAIYVVAPQLGIVGVAMVWTCRAIADACALFIIAERMLHKYRKDSPRLQSIGLIVVASFFLLSFFTLGWMQDLMLIYQILAAFVLLIVLLLWEWLFLLNRNERGWVCQQITGFWSRKSKLKNV